MTRYLVTLRSTADRERAMRLVNVAPFGSRVEVKAEKRSMPQNDRMWWLLSEVSRQVTWHGQRLRPNDFKLIFLDALKRETRPVPNIDNTGFVNLGNSSSDLTKSEMGDLLTIIEAFAAQHGVLLGDEENAA